MPCKMKNKKLLWFAILLPFIIKFKNDVAQKEAPSLSVQEEMTAAAELGALLTEKVTLSFQEYKNSAEMTFSKIPMTYKKGGEDLRFNSSGMFSIKGDCLGQACCQ
jgi:hypothetical protein